MGEPRPAADICPSSSTNAQGTAAIPAEDRRLVVGQYVKHLVDTPLAAAIISEFITYAHEHQHKYLKSRVRKTCCDSTDLTRQATQSP